VNSIITSIWLALQTQGLVFVKDFATDGALGGGSWIRSTKNLAAEVVPAKRVGGPRDSVPIDFLTRVAVGYMGGYQISEASRVEIL
jgi:hypothetical protein